MMREEHIALIQRKNMKNIMRNLFLLALIMFGLALPNTGSSEASEMNYVRNIERMITNLSFDDERNIERNAVTRVQPAYPPNAQKYRIEGVVTVSVSVNSEGKVSKAEFVRGHNLFRSVSLDAAKRWEFKLSGESSLEGTIRFTFKLAN
jgi:TonB family protein